MRLPKKFETPVGSAAGRPSLGRSARETARRRAGACFGPAMRNGKGDLMSTNDTYLAVFLGSKTSARMKAWMALPDAERRAKEQEGMAAWKAWMEKHQAAVATMGGPLGKT